MIISARGTPMRQLRSGGGGTNGRVSLPVWRLIGVVLVMLTGALTAYYTTVYGIRLTLSEKADRQAVERIDRRLVTIETLLRADVVHRSDLEAFRRTVDQRLIRIETLLETQAHTP
jgi:hypothetical protein